MWSMVMFNLGLDAQRRLGEMYVVRAVSGGTPGSKPCEACCARSAVCSGYDCGEKVLVAGEEDNVGRVAVCQGDEIEPQHRVHHLLLRLRRAVARTCIPASGHGVL